jgi:hypothetical protein
MILEAISPSCWSDLYVLKINGRPWGEFRGRWISENVDVALTGRRHFSAGKIGWLGSRFALVDESNGQVLAEGSRCGVFTSAWDLRLSIGMARLISAGWFNTGYRVLQDDRMLAEVNQTGLCNGGWIVQDDGSLQESDALFVGLTYRTILRRNAAASSTATV